MKALFSILTLLTLFNVQGCNRSTDDFKDARDEVPIERQEEYDREDTMERRSIPVESDDELELDRDVFGDDEVEIDD